VIDWIHERCMRWGCEFRIIHNGKDGWPSKTTLGRMIEEGALGASVGRFVQHFPEVFKPEALETNNAIKQLGGTHREIVFLHYVVIEKAKIKAQIAGITRANYYNRLDSAHNQLSGMLSILIGQNRPKVFRPIALETGYVRA
jgi:hypothetical protein